MNAKKVKDECVQWIRDWFEENGRGCPAVIGISGGKDSTIAAELCAEALGRNNVLGVLLPDGAQDMSAALEVVDYLDIEYITVNIGKAVNAIEYASPFMSTRQSRTNLPARMRMCALYMVSQSVDGRVVNTCNRSENYVGYSTKYGDAAGDFSPLSNLLVREVKAIGYELGLPAEFIEKAPEDGLCGKTDEENLGFTYKMLDAYIGDGIEPPAEIKEKIDKLHEQNLFKLLPMASFKPKSAG